MEQPQQGSLKKHKLMPELKLNIVQEQQELHQAQISGGIGSSEEADVKDVVCLLVT